MRPVHGFSRRFFLTRLLAGLWTFALTWVAGPRRARAEDPDYFSGTDYVGKTRVGPHKNFYINYWKPMRRIDPQTWQLEVGGLCEAPATFTLADLQAFATRTQTSRLKCVECWSAKAEWRGFHFSDLQQLCPPHAEATGVAFHCADAYIEHLSLAELNHPRTLLVTHMNGTPLSDEHGFPLRIIAPFKYGYKNPKAILRIEYVDAVQYGTWSKIGPYSPDGTILPGTDHPLELGKQPHRIPGGEIKSY